MQVEDWCTFFATMLVMILLRRTTSNESLVSEGDIHFQSFDNVGLASCCDEIRSTSAWHTFLSN